MATPPSKSWRAIRIIAGSSPCDAARRAEGKRVLTKDAPRLPLRDCDRQNTCQCTYKHLTDRRGGLRRTIDSGFGIPKAITPEKRRPGERRERKR